MMPIEPKFAALLTSIDAQLDRLTQAPPSAGLFVVATPIGHLADITVRALATLQVVDVIYAEDTRHSRTLLQQYGITTPLRAYHDHSSEAVRHSIVQTILEGARVGLISDAGTPMVSDPGFKLIRAVIDAELDVVPLPGASAVMAAIMCAGLPTDRFQFAGFLPTKRAARLHALEAAVDAPVTSIWFEAPSRLLATLADMQDIFGERKVVVLRELTKHFEDKARGPAADLLQKFTDKPVKGEVVIMLEPAQSSAAVGDGELQALLKERLGDTTLRDAVQMVAKMSGTPRKRVYDLALHLQRSGVDK
ncbi:MAG: 16S rRNA (cytidine(1402)-2'-O)-methyltransferase [Pseudomonadota bacterium]